MTSSLMLLYSSNRAQATATANAALTKPAAALYHAALCQLLKRPSQRALQHTILSDPSYPRRATRTRRTHRRHTASNGPSNIALAQAPSQARLNIIRLDPLICRPIHEIMSKC